MSIELTGTALARTVSVVGTIAVVGSGMWMYAGSSIDSEVAFIRQTVPEIRSMIINDNNAVNATTANVVAAARVPTERVNGVNMTSGWGNITIAPANVTGAANDGFAWSYPAALSTRQCNNMVDNIASMANTITVNGTVVKANAASLQTATKITQCATSPATVAFGFSKSGS